MIGPMNRREFAESVMTAALVPLLGPAVVPSPGWWDAPASAGARTALAAADGLDAAAEALAGVVRALYGSRLDDADMAAITRQIRAALGRGELMRKVDLANGDEPDFVFTAPWDTAR